MKRVLSLLLALSVGLNAGLFYVQNSGPKHEGPDRKGPPREDHRGGPPSPDNAIRNHLEGMTRHLDLSEEQQDAIREVLAENMPLMGEMRRRSEEANRRISEVFAAANFDEEQFKQLVGQASFFKARADSISAVMLLGEAAALTAEQRAKYAEIAPTVHSTPQRNPRPPRRNPPPGRRGP